MNDLETRFLEVFDDLKSQLLSDPAFDHTVKSRARVEEIIEYNVPGGKLSRGLAVVESLKLLLGQAELTNDDFFLASVLGWCIEWLQACFLVLDDVIDRSVCRRGHSSWLMLTKDGYCAVNDGFLLRNHVSRLLKTHFREKPYYIDLVELFNEVEFQTASGQMINLIATISEDKDLSEFSLPMYHQIVKNKTAYYSFYLPVACALLISGEYLENYDDMKSILLEMGTYFQVLDDYLDCFGDPEVTGKIGSDIEDFKCSWLVVKALELSNEEQKKLLKENYGKKDPTSIAKVKDIYEVLNLQGAFEEFETRTYENLTACIEAYPSEIIQGVLKSFLEKIHKRQKY